MKFCFYPETGEETADTETLRAYRRGEKRRRTHQRQLVAVGGSREGTPSWAEQEKTREDYKTEQE